MTVSTTTSRADYTGNGATTAFSVPFYFLDNTHLVVYRTVIATGVSTTLVLNSDYTVTGAGVPAGGTVTFTTAPTIAQRVSILRSVPLTQLTAYVPNDPFPAASHERALDQLTMQVQQINESVSRSLLLSPTTTGVSAVLPSPAANKLLGWDTSAAAIQNVDPASLLTIAGSSGFNTQTFSGTGSQTVFTLSQNPGVIANLEVYVSGVRQTPTIDYGVSSTTLTFVAAPPAGTNNILVRWGTTLGISAPGDNTVTTAKLVDASVTTVKIADGSVTPAKLATSGYELGARNRVINGGMIIDQRYGGGPQTFTAGAALAYSVDRWYGYCTGANVSGQRVTGAVANTFRYAFTGAASVTGIGFGQRIEGYNSADLAGTTATLSVDLGNSLLTTVTWTAYYATTLDSFGTLASPTRTTIASGTFTVTSTVLRYSATISVPAAATTGIEIVFSVGAQTSGTWTIGNVQFERGSVATPFEYRHGADVLAQCQRYYETGSFGYNGSYQTAGNGCFFYTPFKVSKRTSAPVMTPVSAISSNLSSLQLTPSNADTFFFGGIAVASGLTVYYGNFNAAAEL